MDYSGKIITKNAVTPTQTAASGVWTLDDALQAQKGNNWPIPGVPNPISKSLRFNSADSAYLTRTPSIAGNRKTWTWSGWVKRSKINSTNFIFTSRPSLGAAFFLYFDQGTGDNALRIAENGGGGSDLITTQLFRDVSAWYHIVVAWDTTQATASNRAKIYVNGVQVTSFATSTYPTQNSNSEINNTSIHSIGSQQTYAAGNYFEGYMTEINFVDGQALTPSDFGMTDTNTGVWIPKKYTGTYGTNGFYVNFKDATNTSTLGLDYSGNGNNWNANNFSVTAGAGNDSLTDVPTPWVGYSVNGDTGGVVRGNYATFNSLNTQLGAGSLTNGNLTFTGPSGSAAYNFTGGTFEIDTSTSTGWYYEVTQTTYGAFAGVSLLDTSFYAGALANDNSIGTGGTNSTAGITYRNSGNIYNYGTATNGLTTWTSNGDVIGIAIKDNKIWFAKNGTWISGDPATGTSPSITLASTKKVTPAATGINSNVFDLNAGQRPFAYTPPAGFLSLCTTNLPTPTIGATSSTTADKYFNTVLRNGFGTSGGTVTTGFYPDFVWQKQRNGLSDHYLANTIAGGTKTLSSNKTTAEATDANWITAFSSTGFTQGSSDFGNSSTTIAVWAWNANSGSTVSNTAGTITSTVSANTTAGFSIVTYTGTGSNATVGHGLGVAPSMIIVKVRNTTDGWFVYNKEIGNTKYLRLNTTDAAATFNLWQSTSPTSTVFSIATDPTVNGSGNTYVAYCFAPVAGYSAFGSYTGNANADGPFIYTGFAPAFVMYKRTDVLDSWVIKDNKRFGYNLNTARIYPNQSLAEDTSTNGSIDLLSNGFKHRSANDLGNQTGGTYIYMALAENPFKYSLAR